VNEKALIKKCQCGDRQAFDELIRLYYDYVSRFLLKTTTNEVLSEDLTQETFLKMIRNIEKFDPGGSAGFGTWLITIAKNCYIDHLRRNRIYLEDIESLPLEDERNVTDEVERKLQYEQILAAMETLPPEQALAIRLKYVEDMTLAQIAGRFGVQPKTIKSRIHDGTVKLRKKLNFKERADDS
jgi:RNA polymerase sigma-70 factor, ECF subfamily